MNLNRKFQIFKARPTLKLSTKHIHRAASYQDGCQRSVSSGVRFPETRERENAAVKQILTGTELSFNFHGWLGCSALRYLSWGSHIVILEIGSVQKDVKAVLLLRTHIWHSCTHQIN